MGRHLSKIRSLSSRRLVRPHSAQLLPPYFLRILHRGEVWSCFLSQLHLNSTQDFSKFGLEIYRYLWPVFRPRQNVHSLPSLHFNTHRRQGKTKKAWQSSSLWKWCKPSKFCWRLRTLCLPSNFLVAIRYQSLQWRSALMVSAGTVITKFWPPEFN